MRMTADDVAVVMHDPDVSRTTDGSGLVRDLHLIEIKRLRIGTADGGETEVPTLDEALACLSGRAAVDIEIKNIPGEPDFDGLAGARRGGDAPGARRDRLHGFALVSSFNPLSIARSRELSPDVPTGLLTTEDVEARVALGFAHGQGHGWVLPFTSRSWPRARRSRTRRTSWACAWARGSPTTRPRDRADAGRRGRGRHERSGRGRGRARRGVRRVILRRRRSTPEVQASFEAFRDVLVHLEPAKAALTDVMPTTRMPGRPLPDALAEFEEGLERSQARMPAWRAPAIEPEWLACDGGWPTRATAHAGSGRTRRSSAGSRG